MCEKRIFRAPALGGALLLACSALVATPAAAVEWTGLTTFGLGMLDQDGEDSMGTLYINGRSRLVFDDRYVLQFQNGVQGYKSGDDTPVSSYLQLDPRVILNSGLEVGPYFAVGVLDPDNGDSTTLKMIGGSARYDMGAAVMSGFAGLTEGASEDLNDYGFSGAYALDPMTTLAGSVMVETGDSGTDTLLGLGAAREVQPGLSVFGGLSYLAADTSEDLTLASVGMSYSLYGRDPGSPVASAELVLADSDGGDATGVRLGITFPVGGVKAVAPSDSHFQSIMDPRRNLTMNLASATGF